VGALAREVPIRDTGRLQFFFHSPDSDLPVRDVRGTQGRGFKTEPYIEKSAENYCCKCLPLNINGFHDRGEQYLFLFTTCRTGDAGHIGKRYVVGYIKRAKFGRNRDGGWAVIGPIKLYAFQDAYRLRLINAEQPRRVRKMLNRREVKRLRGHFSRKRSILERCRDEVRRLKKKVPREVKKEQEKGAKACKLYS
jgi:hypothetical protein